MYGDEKTQGLCNAGKLDERSALRREVYARRHIAAEDRTARRPTTKQSTVKGTLKGENRFTLAKMKADENDGARR